MSEVTHELVPSSLEALAAARTDLDRRWPGPARAPRRAFELLVIAVEHAAALADSVAERLRAGAGEEIS